jgi:hypothetical protein
MSTCDKCRFAERNDSADWVDDDEAQRNIYAQAAGKMVERFPFVCIRTKMSDGQPEDPETLAFTMDGSEYRGELLVSRNFGCVMFAPTTEPQP